MFSSVIGDKATYVLEKQGYAEEDEFMEWAFEADRKENEVKTIFTGDGSVDGKEVLDDDGYFYANVYMLDAPKYRDESNTKNVAYMVFESEDIAKEAIAALAEGTLSYDAFNEVATDMGAAANEKIENYVSGGLGVADFDTWLFDDETEIGAYTETPITVSEGTYLVAYYYEDGEVSWKVTVKNTLASERYEAYYTNMVATYPVTIKEKALANINVVA